MTLKEFIKRYIARNTIIRLWYKSSEDNNSNCLIYRKDESKVGGIDDVCMEWQISNDNLNKDRLVWQRKYANAKVTHITDIVCETYREAINIVIDVSEIENIDS